MRLLFCLSHSIAVLFLLRDVASHFKSILYNIPTEPNLWLNANNVAQLTKLKKKKDTGKYTIGNIVKDQSSFLGVSQHMHTIYKQTCENLNSIGPDVARE